MAFSEVQNERWLDVPGYEGLYEVSDLGRVRNSRGTVLKDRILWTGYNRAALNKNGCAKSHFIHRIVCAAFIGPIPVGKEVNHIDGDRLNNRIENLEYVTRKENAAHRKVLGTSGVGETNPNAKLKPDDVRAIRRLRGLGVSRRNVADNFGVSVFMVTKLTNGDNWQHI